MNDLIKKYIKNFHNLEHFQVLVNKKSLFVKRT